ncbi:MAG: extracellular solute-binding protein [Pseudomonadota bacterium]
MKFASNSILYTIIFALFAQPLLAQDELNVYSARKEALIKPLLDQFAEQNNVTVNLVTSKADALIQRLLSEGKNSPADVLITVDAGRLYRAKKAGLFQALDPKIFSEYAPPQYQDPEGYWFGLSMRVRMFVYDPNKVDPSKLSSYESLASPEWENKICIRSSNNIYNQSLVASLIAHHGIDNTQVWANEFIKTFARKPQGGDRDQIKAVAAGQCELGIVNTYYLGQMLTGTKEEQTAASKVKVFWPNQKPPHADGAHVNVSGIGVTKHAKNPGLAIKLIEYLYSDESQAWYANVNFEYPVRSNIPINDILTSWGEFTADTINLDQLGILNGEAVQVMDRAGWR